MPNNFYAYNPNLTPAYPVYGTGAPQYANPGYIVQSQPQAPQYPVQQGTQLHYVHGLAGANAYQMPPGVTEDILWDVEKDSFYIKKLDEMGRPKVVAHKDFFDHVEPETPPEAEKIDTSKYVTHDDLMQMLSQIDLSSFLTKDHLDKALNELVVGERGKVVRKHE